MTPKEEGIAFLAGLLVVGITLIVIGAVVTMPSRTESVSIGYSKVEDVDDNTKKVTVNYKGQEKVLSVTKEVNWAPKLLWRHTLDVDKKLVAIEYNPTNDKDFDVYTGPPQYVGSGFLIFIGAIFIAYSGMMGFPIFKEIKEKGFKEAMRE